jgi:NADPH2:quinone reductase
VFPHILGRDGVGVVSAVGPGVVGTGVGDVRVILRSEIGVSRAGTFAQKVAVPVESLVAVPAGWTDEQAGGAPLVYLTAYQALTQWGDQPPGVVLITGASGGVGVAAVHLARVLGHEVVALSRDAEKRGQLRSLGAEHTVDPGEPNWPKLLKAQLGGRRIDLAIDNVGGPLLPQVIETLGEWGRVSLVGALAGPVPQFNTATLFFRRLRIGGVAVGTYSPAESQEAWERALGLLAPTNTKPLVDRVFAFDELPEAFERLKSGPMGKVVLAVKSPSE